MGYDDDDGDRDDARSGGIRKIPVETAVGTHEQLLAFDSWLPGAGVEYSSYDQLDSGWSDAPDDLTLVTVERYVDEVEQVPDALDGGR